MATFAIGDIQGCLDEFLSLLEVLQFDKKQDVLWFTGDLVNRGPKSLETLRYIKDLGEQHIIVLGNHDLHLIALAYNARAPHRGDTLKDILHAKDRIELIEWLRHQSLLHYDSEKNYVITHAGIAPCWTINQASHYANEAEAVLHSDEPASFLREMYGNYPDIWDDRLQGADRYRCIINYLTRMRFCYPDGRLNLTYKGTVEEKATDLIPWFDVPNRVHVETDIIFGHWAALGGKADDPTIHPLDTGCVWGNRLTALRLEDKKLFSVPCSKTLFSNMKRC